MPTALAIEQISRQVDRFCTKLLIHRRSNYLQSFVDFPKPSFVLPLKLDIIRGKEAAITSVAAQPPVLVRELLSQVSIGFQHERSRNMVIPLTISVILAPSGKLSSLSSAAS